MESVSSLIDLDSYDLSTVICLVISDSPATHWAFAELSSNKSLHAPRAGPKSISDDSFERAGTPAVAIDEPVERAVLALTTDMLELLDPNRGLVLGSDKAVCHITLDDNKMRGVSSKHIRIFLDPEDETANDKITMECISRVNGFRVVSTSKKLDESINPRQKVNLNGGLWSVKLLAKIDVDFLIYFPDHGPAQKEYDTNCRALRGAEKIGKAGSYTTIASVDPTPQITEPLFKIDWESKILGEGTFGQVRYASDWSGTTVYAAKIFKRKGKAQIERRFLEGIRHTHIVKYQAFMENNENDVLIMELLEGGTLRNLLNEKQHLRPRQIRRYWYEISDALSCLHSQGILHRDIKPENILFDARGIIKLCDFGFAKQLMEDELYTYSQVGSPRYAAPEIVKGRGYDEACDMWSFGIVVLEMHSILPGATGPWRINGGVESPQWQAFIAAVNEQVNGLDNSYFLLKSQLSPEPRGRPKPATLMVELWERYSDDIKLAREIAQRDWKKRKAPGSVSQSETKRTYSKNIS